MAVPRKPGSYAGCRGHLSTLGKLTDLIASGSFHLEIALTRPLRQRRFIQFVSQAWTTTMFIHLGVLSPTMDGASAVGQVLC